MKRKCISRRHFMIATAGGVAACDVTGRHTYSEPTTTTSPADSLVRSVRYLGNQFTGNPVGVTGMDGATSTLLPTGESLWLFGDTVEGPFDSIYGMDLSGLCSNTGAIIPRQSASNGIRRFEFLAQSGGKRPRQLVPFIAGEDPAKHRIWAIHGVCVDDQIYVFYHRITLIKDVDVFASFQLDGMGIARSKIGEFQFQRLTAPDDSTLFWKGDAPTFGVFVERKNDCVYLWGSLTTGMHLARTRPQDIADLASYEYLTEAPGATRPNVKPRWSKTFAPTGVLFDSVPNEMSAAYNQYLGKYLAFHSLHREHKIVMRTAPHITGPWSDGVVVYRPERIKDTDLVYAAKEHPELAREKGRVLYVTFVNSTTYIPQLVELTLR